MSYKILTKPTVGNRWSTKVADVPDGQWIVLDVYWERHEYRGPKAPDKRDAEVIGLGDHPVTRHRTHEHSYNNAGGGISETGFFAFTSAYPFAVVQYHGIGENYVFANVWSARQIHKDELGRYPDLPGLPEVVCERADQKRGGVRKFVRWSEVAASYGEANLRKLWGMFMPFWRKDYGVTYAEASNVAAVRYPGSLGQPRAYWSEEFRTGFTEERVQKHIDEHGLEQERADALHARMEKFRQDRRIEHAALVEQVRNRQWVPGGLWDDPVLELEHLCVPLSFARSVLICKRFGFVPDFSGAMAAMALYKAKSETA